MEYSIPGYCDLCPTFRSSLLFNAISFQHTEKPNKQTYDAAAK